MNANLRYASTQIGAALFIGQKDNGLGRSGKEPTLYEMLTVLEICSQTASAHVVIVFASVQFTDGAEASFRLA